MSIALLSIFLTLFGALAHGEPVDRRAFVSSAYEGFFGTLFILSGSDTFLDQLTPNERAEFFKVGNTIIQRFVRLGPPIEPGSDRTSMRTQIKLRFSDKSEDFIIAPDKTERTAKMDGDIWFNLKMINDPTTSFGLLDAMQILFHEFGHVLGEKKNQALVDQIAAKMRNYLGSFYKEHAIVPGLKVHTLVLPYVTVLKGPVDLQPEPMIVFDVRGQAKPAQVTGVQFLGVGEGFMPTDPALHAFTRLDLKPSISAYADQKILFEWSIESKHVLIHAPVRSNFLDLYSNLSKSAPHHALAPMISYNTLYQMVDAQTVLREPQVPLKNYAENPKYFGPDIESKWMEPLKITTTRNDRAELEGVIQSREPVTEVSIHAQKRNNTVFIPAEVEKLTEGFYRVRASVPAANPEGAKVYVFGAAINSKNQLDLPERLDIPTRSNSPAGELKLRSLEVWDGSNWIQAEKISTTDFTTGEVKMRFHFQNAKAELNHIEGFWIFQDAIEKGNDLAGARHRKVLEIIPRSRLKQTLKNGELTVEFESRKMSNERNGETGKFRVTTRDSGVRAIEKIQFVDTSLNVTAIGTRMLPLTWRSVIQLKKSRSKACHAAF